jgi:nucleoside-diphosphate kinase
MKTLYEYIAEANLPEIVKVGDKSVEKDQVNGFCILKPEFLDHEDDFKKMLTNNGWRIMQTVRRTLTHDEAEELYKMHKSKKFYKDLCNYMSSSDCICCMCYKDCDNPIKDMKTIKDMVRKAWGIDDMKNGMHSSDTLENVKREYKLIFENKYETNDADK